MADTSPPAPPRGLMRWLMRAPVGLFRLRLGWLMSERFLMLTHIGRKSGLPRHTVLEAIFHDPDRDLYLVASGWGEQADWVKNITANPHALLSVGKRRLEVTAIRLDVEETVRALYAFATQQPEAFKELLRRSGVSSTEHVAADCELLAKKMPFVLIEPYPVT